MWSRAGGAPAAFCEAEETASASSGRSFQTQRPDCACRFSCEPTVLLALIPTIPPLCPEPHASHDRDKRPQATHGPLSMDRVWKSPVTHAPGPETLSYAWGIARNPGLRMRRGHKSQVTHGASSKILSYAWQEERVTRDLRAYCTLIPGYAFDSLNSCMRNSESATLHA